MLDFFFFVKTFILTLIVVLVLQVEIGNKTAETYVHDWMVGSVAAGWIGHAARGGSHFLKDAAFKMTQKMHEHIGMKEKKESSETRSSHFHWGWNKASDTDIKNSPAQKSRLNAVEQDPD
jgi:hypothetical protein